MSKTNVSLLSVVLGCSILIGCFLPGYVFGRESSLEERVARLEHELTRAQAVIDIMNLQARYVNIHNRDERLSWMLFADRPDTTKEITHTRLIGFDNIKKAYLEGEAAVLASGNLPEGTIIGWTGGPPGGAEAGAGGVPTAGMAGMSGMGGMGGGMRIHPISTPAIVVAGDGKTAKATFHSLGFEGEGWCYGMYANDYIKIDGEWYIWHMKWLRCFRTTAWDQSFSEQTLDEIYEFTQGEKDEWGFPKVNEGINYNYLYAPGKEVKTIPAPKPYETWTEADENGGWWKRDVIEP